MITNHRITQMLASERVTDVGREPELLPACAGTQANITFGSSVCVPVRRASRRRVYLPITARGVAWLEDYHRQGGQR